MTRLQTYVLLAGMVAGMLLGISAGTLTRADVLAPVLAIGLTAPLGWAGMDMVERIRSRRRRTGSDDSEGGA
jgi:hypothetical protein